MHRFRLDLRAVPVAVLAAAVAACPATSAGVAAASGGGAAVQAPTATQASSPAPPSASGGAGLGGPAPTPTSVTRARSQSVPKPPSKRAKGKWYHGVTLTEYWPAPESWFVGALVPVPGLTDLHRIDWLYSASGVSMEGEGIGLDGQMVHIAALGDGGWVTADGKPTIASRGWVGGTPYWRAGAYWQTAQKAVTFPLAAGGWSNGTGKHYVPLPGVTFAQGPSLPLRFWRSIAVDPKVIPLGSRVYIPAYRTDGYGGWFVAQDTGGAITGRHIDVYRRPPAASTDTGAFRTRQMVFVVPPAKRTRAL